MKKTYWLHLLFFALIFIALVSCKQEKKRDAKNLQITNKDSLDFTFQTKLKYAKGFTVINHKNYKEIYVSHPLTGDTMGRYITKLPNTVLHDSIKSKGHVINVPAKTLGCLSTTEVGCLALLDIREKLIGCSSPNHVWDKELSDRIQKGEIQEISRGHTFSIENIIALSPELLMQNFMNKTDVDGTLTNAGITVLYNNAWKEQTLLGRGEWFKFVAMFFCKEQMADSIFNQIEKNYNEVKAIATTSETKSNLMYGNDYKGIWYLPQNGTYVSQTIRDANAIFKGAGDGNSSIPKSFEEIYDMFHDAEYWLTTQAKVKTMKEFLASNERYIDFNAAQKGNVFINNKREKPTGGNDYWESGINRPDLLLKDIAKILHPELFPDYETVYWRHLE